MWAIPHLSAGALGFSAIPVLPDRLGLELYANLNSPRRVLDLRMIRIRIQGLARSGGSSCAKVHQCQLPPFLWEISSENRILGSRTPQSYPKPSSGQNEARLRKGTEG